MTVLESIKLSTEFLEKKGIESPRLNAEILLAEILKCKRIDLYLKFDQPLKEIEVDIYREWITRRGRFEPLQYIIGKVDFYGLTLEVTPAVLIPRPETEILVETIINDYKANGAISLLDIGVGSGCISLALAKNLTTCQVHAIDISEEAVKVAAKNFSNHSADNNLKLFTGDIRNWKFENTFDIVISNPPYVSKTEFSNLQKEIKDYEPNIAVTDGSDGLEYYRIICSRLNSLLNPLGKIYFEVGQDQASSVEDILLQNGITIIQKVRDLQGIERVVVGVKE